MIGQALLMPVKATLWVERGRFLPALGSSASDPEQELLTQVGPKGQLTFPIRQDSL